MFCLKENTVVANLRKFALGFTLLCLAIAAYAQNPFDAHKQFSATMVMTGAPMAGHGQGDMKVYRLNDKMRTNIGTMGYSIIDLTQHTMYMVMGQGMCMQMSPRGQQNPFAEQGSVERTPAGTDTVDGHPCKVENVTVTPQNGTPTKMKVWEADDLQGFPVKVEIQSNKGPVTVMYKDVSLDAPAASLFTHPDNCRQMPSMPGGPQ
jgi:outer membrane lipoprotein-sorting protein